MNWMDWCMWYSTFFSDIASFSAISLCDKPSDLLNLKTSWCLEGKSTIACSTKCCISSNSIRSENWNSSATAFLKSRSLNFWSFRRLRSSLSRIFLVMVKMYELKVAALLILWRFCQILIKTSCNISSCHLPVSEKHGKNCIGADKNGQKAVPKPAYCLWTIPVKLSPVGTCFPFWYPMLFSKYIQFRH